MAVACSSRDAGAVVRKICPVGCIGCKICVKQVPEVFAVSDNLAVDRLHEDRRLLRRRHREVPDEVHRPPLIDPAFLPLIRLTFPGIKDFCLTTHNNILHLACDDDQTVVIDRNGDQVVGITGSFSPRISPSSNPTFGFPEYGFPIIFFLRHSLSFGLSASHPPGEKT